jgi:hypothetical protein
MHHFYGESMRTEWPAGSGNKLTLNECATDLCRVRLALCACAARLDVRVRQRQLALFMLDKDGKRPCNGNDERYVNDKHFKNLVLFHEYFHGDTGAGLGASHQVCAMWC